MRMRVRLPALTLTAAGAVAAPGESSTVYLNNDTTGRGLLAIQGDPSGRDRAA